MERSGEQNVEPVASQRDRASRRRRASDRLAADLAADYLAAIRATDGGEAERVASGALATGLPPAAVLSRVVAPAMEQVGLLWDAGELSVADEHAATAITHRVLASVYARSLTEEPADAACVMLAAIEGERHSLGVLMAADLLELAGYRVINLTADVPTGSLLEAIWRHRPDLVGLSSTVDGGGVTMEEVIGRVREISPLMPIVTGGAAGAAARSDPKVRHVPDLEQLEPVVAELLDGGPRRPEVAEPLSGARDRPDVDTADRFAGERRPDPRAAIESIEQTAELVRRKAREAIGYRTLAFRDPLSGLPNRRALDDRFNQHLADPRGGPPGVLMLADLDDLKRINDEFGHQAGDRALTVLADVLERESRSSDFAARLGGDEFAVLLPGASAKAAVRLGELIMSRLAAREAEPPFTISIGIAEIHESKRATLIAADQALYQAKAAGRNAIRVAETR